MIGQYGLAARGKTSAELFYQTNTIIKVLDRVIFVSKMFKSQSMDFRY